MDTKQISILLNEGRVIQWNEYRKMHPDWVPDLRGLNLESAEFARGLEDAFASEHFNLNGAIYDITTKFQPHFNPEEFGIIYQEQDTTDASFFKKQNDNVEKKAETTDLYIFITHSSEDNGFVEALIDLIRMALNISPKKIRCTSVPGYRLPTGAETDKQLRQEVYDAKVLIGVITKSSMKSAYVLFELGARWFTRKKMFPILACGADSSVLAGPLKAINSLSCDNSADIHQLIDDLASEIGVDKQITASYQNKIEKLVDISTREGKNISGKSPAEETREVLNIYKTDFLRFLRRFETEWNSERDSDPVSIEDGIYIIDSAYSDVVDFRSQIEKDDDAELTNILEETAKRLKLLQKYEEHHYDEFWKQGNEIIKTLRTISKILDKHMEDITKENKGDK